jgi:2-hydroxychromene-2-carboxylate isomerase
LEHRAEVVVMSTPMRFHFDFISPYSYLAWTQIHRVAEAHGREVEPVPVLFAALLDAHGTKGPAEVPAKRRYLARDTMRRAAMLGVPFQPPPNHPFNPLLALRVASLPLEAASRRALVDRLFRATWADGGGIEAAQVPSLLDQLGHDGAKLVAEAQSAEGKERVRAQTARAIEEGVFGVPTVLVDGESFWGVDSLDALDRHLDGGFALDPAVLARFAALAPSASRPGGS